VGTLIVANLYQSAGIVPHDVTALNRDFATGGSVKWLLGGPGAGYLYVRADLDLKLHPSATGWAAHAHPFEFTNGPIDYARTSVAFSMKRRTSRLCTLRKSGYEIVREIGVGVIRARSQRQTQRLISLARDADITVTSPLNPEVRGGPVILNVPNGREVTAELGRRQILVDYRPGAGVSPTRLRSESYQVCM
jgi:kynureninase